MYLHKPQLKDRWYMHKHKIFIKYLAVGVGVVGGVCAGGVEWEG